MFDIKWIRENPDAFDQGLKARGLDPQAKALLKLDEERRTHVNELQDLQNRRNAASKEIGAAKGRGDDARAEKLIAEVATLKEKIQTGEAAERDIDAEIREALSGIPNLPLDDVPAGADETANVELRAWGDKPSFDFKPKQHYEIGEALGLMDFETAAKLSGSRFVVLKGQLARLERALAAFMLDLHTTEFGYQEILPPALVRDDALFGTGQLPKFKQDLFAASNFWIAYEEEREQQFSEFRERRATQEERRKESLERQHRWSKKLEEGAPEVRPSQWLIPTAEVPLTNLVRDAIQEEAALPIRVTAHTPCFRAEAGAAGRDTRGMIRQHQFSKVELVSITTPEQSTDELERMTGCAEEVLKRLELPYRTMVLSSGDMGFAARKTYDIEVWLPGQDAYREISSCSVCGDFQARRMNARYRVAGGKEIRYLHTLNGSGLAVGRTMIAILENFQNEDGSVTIPHALHSYMGGRERIERMETA